MNNNMFNNFLTTLRVNRKYIITTIILMLFICGGVFSYLWLVREKAISKLPTANKEGVEKFLHYYSQSYNPDVFTIHALNLNISSEDKIINKLEGRFSVLGNFLEKGKFLVCKERDWPAVCDNKLYILDAETGELKEFITLEEGKHFESAAFSHDKNFLAYTLYQLEKDNEKAAGEVWIYNLKEKTHKKIFEKRPLLLYAGLKVLGWNSKDDKVVIREMGGDAGEIWGDIYLVEINKTEGNYKKIEVGEGQKNFLVGELSPNGENFLYIFCKKPTSEGPEEYAYSSCEEGAEIRIYNFATSGSTLIYKNLSYSDNILRRKLRVIDSALWQDDENIIFSIPDGIYKINLKSKQPEELYRFEWRNPNEIFKFPSMISYADKDFVIYNRYNLHEGTFILDLTTKKVMELGKRMFDIDGFLR